MALRVENMAAKFNCLNKQPGRQRVDLTVTIQKYAPQIFKKSTTDVFISKNLTGIKLNNFCCRHSLLSNFPEISRQELLI